MDFSEAKPHLASWRPADISRTNQWLYQAHSSWAFRTIQRLRPYICPFEAIAEHVPQNARLLDIGCGSGMLLCNLFLRNRIATGIGVDISAKPISAAQLAAAQIESISKCPPLLSFELRPTETLLPQETYDAISLVDVIHHVPPHQQENFLRAAVSRLSPDGIFIYKDMTRKSRFRAHFNRLHDLAMAKQWIHYLPIEKAAAILEQTGAKPIAQKNITLGPYGHELVVCKKCS